MQECGPTLFSEFDGCTQEGSSFAASIKRKSPSLSDALNLGVRSFRQDDSRSSPVHIPDGDIPFPTDHPQKPNSAPLVVDTISNACPTLKNMPSQMIIKHQVDSKRVAVPDKFRQQLFDILLDASRKRNNLCLP